MLLIEILIDCLSVVMCFLNTYTGCIMSTSSRQSDLITYNFIILIITKLFLIAFLFLIFRFIVL